MKGSFHKSGTGTGLVSNSSLQAVGNDKLIQFPLCDTSVLQIFLDQGWKNNPWSLFTLWQFIRSRVVQIIS